MSDTRPDLLDDMPVLIAAAIKQRLPDLRECEAMAGPFNLEALTQKGIAAPAVLVSILRIRQTELRAGPQPEFVASVSAYVVTKDRLGLQRDAAAAAICQAILPMVEGQTWSDAFIGPAKDVEARSLVTANTRKAAASLWAVTWSQPFVLTFEPTQEIDPVVYLGHAPDIGPDHADDYAPFGEAAS